MSHTHNEAAEIISKSLASGRGRADIESALAEKGFEPGALSQHIESHIAEYAARKRASGQMLIAIGILICFGSCVITLITGTEGNSAVTLIGLTSLGIIVLFAGLSKIF